MFHFISRICNYNLFAFLFIYYVSVYIKHINKLVKYRYKKINNRFIQSHQILRALSRFSGITRTFIRHINTIGYMLCVCMKRLNRKFSSKFAKLETTDFVVLYR